MPNKRSKRRKVKQYSCPLCMQRLWRLGTSKYHLFYRSASEISENTGITPKKSKFLATQKNTYLDSKRWIEGFCCSNHGSLWVLISTHNDKHEYRLAKEKDWLRTERTLDPRILNPSVSEYTLRMSRKPR